MSKRSDIDLLDDILICMEKIQSYLNGLTYDQFSNDSKTQDAIRNDNLKLTTCANPNLTTPSLG